MTTSKNTLKNILRTSLQQTFAQSDLIKWFDPLHVQYDAQLKLVNISLPHIYFGGWFASQGKASLEQELHKIINDKDIKIVYNTPNLHLPNALFTVGEKNTTDYSIENFIYNKKNEFPIAAVKELCKKNSSVKYNPFTIYGKISTGKSYILRSIYNYLSSAHNINNLFFGNISSLIDNIYNINVDNFIKKYKIVIIDDIQQLHDNISNQEIMIELIDKCIYLKKQIILSCSSLPSHIDEFSNSLKSRLEVGLVVEIKEPDIDVRMRFAVQKCTQFSITLEREHILMLAQKCSNIRHLNGVILKIAAFQSLAQRSIQTEDIINILQSSGEDKTLTARNIISTVSGMYNLSDKDILGNKRQKIVVETRQISMYLCRELLGMSYPAIGRYFGGKDHSTVIHSIKKIKEIMLTDKDIYNKITELKKKCLAH